MQHRPDLAKKQYCAQENLYVGAKIGNKFLDKPTFIPPHKDQISAPNRLFALSDRRRISVGLLSGTL
jgi:hypothetical protein